MNRLNEDVRKFDTQDTIGAIIGYPFYLLLIFYIIYTTLVRLTLNLCIILHLGTLYFGIQLICAQAFTSKDFCKSWLRFIMILIEFHIFGVFFLILQLSRGLCFMCFIFIKSKI